ncbi:hypothetical protein [Streptomyces sp. NPDC054765]
MGRLLFSTDAYGPFSTDASGLPELYVVGGALFRTAPAAVPGDRTTSGAWSAEDARRVGALIAADNARRVYRLSGN